MATVWLTREECEDGDLPDVCCVCGDAAEQVSRQQFCWHPAWGNWAVLSGVLHLFVTRRSVRRMWFPAPVCDAHRGYWSRFRLTVWGVVLGCLAVGVVGLLLVEQGWTGPGLLVTVGGGAGLVGLVVCLPGLWAARVRPLKITHHDMRLTNVSEEFAAAVKAHRDT